VLIRTKNKLTWMRVSINICYTFNW